MSRFPIRSAFFDEIFQDLNPGFYVKPLHGDALPQQIKVQVNENDQAYTIQAELPGVARDDIHVDVHGNLVTLKAEVRQHDKQSEADQVLRSERYYGSVSRSFELPVEVEADTASARYDNGILLLTLPKKLRAPGSKRLAIE
jgi:HSP20 family protein